MSTKNKKAAGGNGGAPKQTRQQSHVCNMTAPIAG